jgi:hypothetical protein
MIEEKMKMDPPIKSENDRVWVAESSGASFVAAFLWSSVQPHEGWLLRLRKMGPIGFMGVFHLGSTRYPRQRAEASLAFPPS